MLLALRWLFVPLAVAGWLAEPGGRVAAQTLPGLTATPAAVTFTYQIPAAGLTASLPVPQTVQVKRTGSGAALDYTVSVTTPGAEWLIVTPLSGKTGTPLSLRVNPTSLLAGTYAATVQIDSAGASAPALVAVTLVIKNPPPRMAASPASVSFSYTTDQTAPLADKTVEISTSGEPVSFTAAAAGGTWLSVTPALGIAVGGSPVTLTIKVNTAGLLPGAYTGRVTVSSANAENKSVVVAVALEVVAGTPVISSIWPNAAAKGSVDTTFTLRGNHFFKGISAVTATVGPSSSPPTPADPCTATTATLTTTWVSPNVMLATVPTALLANVCDLSISVANGAKTALSPATFLVTTPGPKIQAVMNAASFAGSSPPAISPGEIVSVFGSGLGPATLVSAVPAGTPLTYPTEVATTKVEFEVSTGNWVPAPVIFTQANQVNVVAPYTINPSAPSSQLRATYNGIQSSPLAFTPVAANPGLFTVDSSGRGQAAALNYNETAGTYSLNSSKNPATKGSIVALYLTGAGLLNPAPAADGVVIAAPAPAPAAAASATLGGDAATVTGAAAVVGAVAGLLQVNIQIPATLKAGKEFPVVVTIGGRSSSANATIAVK